MQPASIEPSITVEAPAARALTISPENLIPEGIEGRVAYKGEVADTIYQLTGGIRSGMGYCGTKTISELQENCEFIKITSAGLKESHPHDVEITTEAPNYTK